MYLELRITHVHFHILDPRGGTCIRRVSFSVLGSNGNVGNYAYSFSDDTKITFVVQILVILKDGAVSVTDSISYRVIRFVVPPCNLLRIGL
jgi:hypothetical protein